MKMLLKSTSSEQDYTGYNENGHTTRINGDGNGISPMQNVLLAVAGCSSIDVEIFLKKMRQNLKSLEVEILGTRREEPIPRVFTDIHLKFKLFGDIKDSSAKKAVSMAVEKYCSVATMFQNNVNITHEHVIIEA